MRAQGINQTWYFFFVGNLLLEQIKNRAWRKYILTDKKIDEELLSWFCMRGRCKIIRENNKIKNIAKINIRQTSSFITIKNRWLAIPSYFSQIGGEQNWCKWYDKME